MPLYTRRPAPIDYRRMKGFLDTEFQNVQRAFRSGAVYPIQPGETGVVDVFFPVGDIRRYGAVSDGSAFTNTVAFRNALLSLPDGVSGITGGVVFVPAGTWAVDGIIGITRDNTTIFCESGAVIDATVDSADIAVFFAGPSTPVDNFTIEGATITGAFPWGVRVSGGSGHAILRNTISGGTVAESGKCGGIYVEDADDVVVMGNRCSGNGDVTLDAGADIQFNNGDTIVADGWILDNECVSTLVCMNIVAYNPLRVKILGNTASGARVTASSSGARGDGILVYKTGGISASDVGDNVVAHNTVYDTEGNGINNQSVPRSMVNSNIVINACTAQTEVSLAVGAIVSESDHGLVCNNTVKDSVKNGIIISGAGSNTLVRGNTVTNPGIDGIVVQGAAPTDVTIEGNCVEDVASGLAIGAWHFSNVAHVRIAVLNNVMRNVDKAVFFSALSDGCVIKSNVSTGLSDTAYIALNQGTNAITEDNQGNGIQFPEGVSPDRGDTDVTVVPCQDFEVQRFATVLTGNRTVTLSSTNARNGVRFRVVRTGLGAFTLDVGGLKTIPSATAAFVDVEYDGTAYRLTGYGTL